MKQGINKYTLTFCIIFSIYFVSSFQSSIYAKPNEAKIGVYVTSIDGFQNFSRNFFNISFYIWWIGGGKDYQPLLSTEITNAQSFDSQFAEKAIFSKTHGADARVYAKINKTWDAVHFPFDTQTLDIILEDVKHDRDELILQPDTRNSGILPSLPLPGWKIESFKLVPGVTTYTTNFGEQDQPPYSQYSNVKIKIQIKRDGWRLFIFAFAGTFLGFICCNLIYFIKTDNLGTRLGLALGAIFLIIGNMYVLSTMLPISSAFTLSDAIQIATYLIFIIVVIESILVAYLKNNSFDGAALITNRIIGILTTFGYLGYVGHKIWVSYHF